MIDPTSPTVMLQVDAKEFRALFPAEVKYAGDEKPVIVTTAGALRPHVGFVMLRTRVNLGS